MHEERGRRPKRIEHSTSIHRSGKLRWYSLINTVIVGRTDAHPNAGYHANFAKLVSFVDLPLCFQFESPPLPSFPFTHSSSFPRYCDSPLPRRKQQRPFFFLQTCLLALFLLGFSFFSIRSPFENRGPETFSAFLLSRFDRELNFVGKFHVSVVFGAHRSEKQIKLLREKKKKATTTRQLLLLYGSKDSIDLADFARFSFFLRYDSFSSRIFFRMKRTNRVSRTFRFLANFEKFLSATIN